MDETSSELAECISKISRMLQHRSRQLPMAPHQARALSMIAQGDTHSAELASQLGVTPRAVTEVVGALAELHLVELTANPKDRREKIISITPAGRQGLEAMQEAQNSIARELFGTLDQKQQQQLKELLVIVIDGAE